MSKAISVTRQSARLPYAFVFLNRLFYLISILKKLCTASKCQTTQYDYRIITKAPNKREHIQSGEIEYQFFGRILLFKVREPTGKITLIHIGYLLTYTRKQTTAHLEILTLIGLTQLKQFYSIKIVLIL